MKKKENGYLESIVPPPGSLQVYPGFFQERYGNTCTRSVKSGAGGGLQGSARTL